MWKRSGTGKACFMLSQPHSQSPVSAVQRMCSRKGSEWVCVRAHRGTCGGQRWTSGCPQMLAHPLWLVWEFHTMYSDHIPLHFSPNSVLSFWNRFSNWTWTSLLSGQCWGRWTVPGTLHAWLSWGCWGLNSGPYACEVSTWLTGLILSPHAPWMIFFFFLNFWDKDSLWSQAGLKHAVALPQSPSADIRDVSLALNGSFCFFIWHRSLFVCLFLFLLCSFESPYKLFVLIKATTK